MSFINPFEWERKLDEAMPVLAFIVVAEAVEAAVTELELEPLADLADGVLESLLP